MQQPDPKTTTPLRDLVSIEGDDIVIRITSGALKFGTEQCPTLQDWSGTWGTFHQVTVTDLAAWRAAILHELRRETEDGTTPVHLLLDEAVKRAFENGEEGVEAELQQI